MPKTTELYTVNGWTEWYEKYISIKTFKKTQTHTLSQNQREGIRDLFHASRCTLASIP